MRVPFGDRLGGVVALAFSVSIHVQAQQKFSTVNIAERVSCPQCSIVMEPVVRIGDHDGPGIVENERSWLKRDGRGRYFLMYAYATSIKVFDSAGKYLQMIGKKGAGPGEFDGVSGMHVGANDTLHVIDWGTSRHNVFAPNLRYVRSNAIALQPQLSWIMLPDAQIVTNLTIRTPEKLGLPLHLLGGNGALVKSFGSETEVHRPDFPGINDRALAFNKGSVIWAAHQRAYVIDAVDVASGTIIKRIIRQADWLGSTPPQRTRIGASPDQPPTARLAAVHQDATGLLWVTISVPDPRWKTAVKPGAPPHVTITDPVRYTDNIIDVIDPVRGELVATQRFDDIPPWFISEGYASQYRTTAEGNPYFQVLRMHLQRR